MKHKNSSLKNGLRFLVLSVSLIYAFFTLSAQSNDKEKIQENKTSCPTSGPAGFLQQHFSVDNIKDSPARFSIHRARLGVKGSFSGKIKYNFIIGAVEPPDHTPALVNGFIDKDLLLRLNFKLTQNLMAGLSGQIGKCKFCNQGYLFKT